MPTTLLRAGMVLPLDNADSLYTPGYVQLEDDRIVAVGPLDAAPNVPFDSVIDMNQRLIMPGLVNAHTHTPMVLFRGVSEGHSLLTLDGWYNTIRRLELVLDPAMIAPAVAVSCAEMLRTGTTCFADQYFYMDQIVPIVRRSGMRAALAYGIVELGDGAAGQRELEAAEAFLEDVGGDPLLHGWVGPHALYVDNQPELIDTEVALAERHGTGLHIHLSTTGEEDRWCAEHYGRSAVQQMRLSGVLERPILAAHCLSIPMEDLDILAAHPFSAVMCASASMRAGVPPAPLKAMRMAGINTAIGTDNVANNNSYDLFNEMQICAKLASLREREPGAVSARDIVHMATRGGAQALGLEKEIGSLEPGKRADLISLDLAGIGWTPRAAQDVYTALVYAISGFHVQDAMVDGRWLLRDQDWTTIDYATERARLDDAYAELQRRGIGA